MCRTPMSLPGSPGSVQCLWSYEGHRSSSRVLESRRGWRAVSRPAPGDRARSRLPARPSHEGSTAGARRWLCPVAVSPRASEAHHGWASFQAASPTPLNDHFAGLYEGEVPIAMLAAKGCGSLVLAPSPAMPFVLPELPRGLCHDGCGRSRHDCRGSYHPGGRQGLVRLMTSVPCAARDPLARCLCGTA